MYKVSNRDSYFLCRTGGYKKKENKEDKINRVFLLCQNLEE